MNRTDLRCLDLLVDRPIGPSTLAAASGLTPATITTVIDRLEAAGYVTRRADPHDRRRIVIEPTATLLAAVATYYQNDAARMIGLLDTMSDSQLRTLIAFFEQRHDLRQVHIDEVRDAKPPRRRHRRATHREPNHSPATQTNQR